MMPVTDYAIDSVTPHELMAVSDFLSGLLDRSPLKAGSGWAAHRIIIGALAAELRLNALAAGEPADVPEELPPAWAKWDRDMDRHLARSGMAVVR